MSGCGVPDASAHSGGAKEKPRSPPCGVPGLAGETL